MTLTEKEQRELIAAAFKCCNADEASAGQHYQVFEELVERGYLVQHNIGTQKDHISHKFTTVGGIEDILTSPCPQDKNYNNLLNAHLARAFQLIKQGIAT